MPEREVKRFGEKLRALRIHQELSVRALASVLGVSPSTIVEIENGKNSPAGIDFVYKLANHFGVSADDLLNDERDI
jgi:transcriptional regulator with XRE-family HTH domain